VTSGPLEAPCRGCGERRLRHVLDLGQQPLATSFPESTDPPDPAWPLRVAVCQACWLLQLEPTGAPPDRDAPEMRGLAMRSESLLDHGRETAATLKTALGLDDRSVIVELASHGNHLRSAFAAAGLRTIILEPDRAAAAELGDDDPDVRFGMPGRATLAELRAAIGAADLIVDDFELVHLPDLDDAVAGLAGLLAPGGALVLVLDHALSVVEGTQLDALRHGHHAVASLVAIGPVLARHGLTVTDATILPLYGGSLRLIARPTASAPAVSPSVEVVRDLEIAARLDTLDAYLAFGDRARSALSALQRHLVDAREHGRRVVGYGAPSRAVTLVTAAGIDTTLLPFTVDRSVGKRGRTLPGSRIPIRSTDALAEADPDEVLILAWPFAEEIVSAFPEVTAAGAQWLIPLPSPTLVAGRTATAGPIR
jgi:C-methyltransferase-like protein/putative zinc binding protein